MPNIRVPNLVASFGPSGILTVTRNIQTALFVDHSVRMDSDPYCSEIFYSSCGLSNSIPKSFGLSVRNLIRPTVKLLSCTRNQRTAVPVCSKFSIFSWPVSSDISVLEQIGSGPWTPVVHFFFRENLFY